MSRPWTLKQQDQDWRIGGPGSLEIILHTFDAARGQRHELPAEVLGTLLQRQWRYPLEDGVWLEGISTGDTAALDHPELHKLHIGRYVTWEMPEDLAEALHALMGGAFG